MKGFASAILFLFCQQAGYSQDEFLKVYLDITETYKRNEATLQPGELHVQDTLQMKHWHQVTKIFYRDSIRPLTKRIINLTFPDINFTDVNDKAWSVSDFKDKEIVVNYNYLYCPGCLDRIDSTVKRTSPKKVKMIVLFLDAYKREISDLKEYDESVMIGFINNDTRDLISLSQGDNCMYYLNKNRQIEFFDKAGNDDWRRGWTDFLDEHLK